MSKVSLKGCRTEPLSDYLKSLAVLRLVSEQADPEALGSWEDGHFCLDTSLGEQGLLDFFCERYAPTPIVSPWNGGSGFYEGDAQEGMAAILASDDARFAGYRAVIDEIRSWPEAPESYPTAGHVRERFAAVCAETSGKKSAEFNGLLESLNAAPDLEGQGIESLWSLSVEELQEAQKRKSLDKKSQQQLKAWTEALKKARTTCKQSARAAGKEQMIALCRARLPETAVLWVDAACALQSASVARYAHLLGSGGNEGRLDYSNNFMQRSSSLLLGTTRATRQALAQASLFGQATAGGESAKIGQFNPGNAGGFNQGTELESKNFKINPWDYLLLLEGSLCFASALVRRSGSGANSISSPFSVHPSAAGYGSASEVDAENGRGEIWLPTWPAPARYRELRHVFGEGRASLRGRQARDGFEFVRAIGRLGVDRGFDTFTRFLFLKRRGDSFVALPSGRFAVRAQPAVRLLDELDPILSRISGFMRAFGNKTPPAALAAAWRRIQTNAFDCAASPDAWRFSALLRVIGQFERELSKRERGKEPRMPPPLGGLSPRWLLAADTGGVELRIAAAIASLQANGAIGPFRANLTPLDPSRPWDWHHARGQVAWRGASLAERLAGVLARRMVDYGRLPSHNFPFFGALRLHPRDLAPWLEGRTDDAAIEELLWAAGWVNWRKSEALENLQRAWHEPLDPSCVLPRAYSQLKLLFDGRLVGKQQDNKLRPEPRIPPLLLAAQPQQALDLAYRRLKSGDYAPLALEVDPGQCPLRLAAALLVPITGVAALRARALLPDSEQKQPKQHARGVGAA